MAETPINEMLKQLRSREPREAWDLFLHDYGSLILQIVRRFEHNADQVSDCFQFVCEQLSRDRFRRLRKFKPQGPARFSTWLRAVVRNLCLDWHRKQFGRRRVFRSISRLSAFDQEVFRCVYERDVSVEETMLLLQPSFPDVTAKRMAESRERIEQELTVNQRWRLGARFAQGASGAAATFGSPLEIPDPRPDPEARALLEEKRATLGRALACLSKGERLLVRLRFEQDLTLEQVAKVLGLGNAQRADRKIKEILTRLREDMN